MYGILFAQLLLQSVQLQAALQIWHLAYLVGHVDAKNSSCKYNVCKCLLI